MSFIQQNPLQGRDSGPDFSKFIDQIDNRNRRIAEKIPNWVKTGVKLYGENEESFSDFLEGMADIVRYNGYQNDYYFDLFLKTASSLKEGKNEDIPLEGLQELDFTGIFHVKLYFQQIHKEVPSIIGNLFQEKRTEEQLPEKNAPVKEIKL